MKYIATAHFDTKTPGFRLDVVGLNFMGQNITDSTVELLITQEFDTLHQAQALAVCLGQLHEVGILPSLTEVLINDSRDEVYQGWMR